MGDAIGWARHFDRIWCFHYLKNADRLPGITDELRRVGILDSGVFSFEYTSPDPWERKLARACPECTGGHASKLGFLNLGLATARKLREALALGYRRVLFLENDIRFLKDLGRIKATLEAMPDGYDIVQLEKFIDHQKVPDAEAYAKVCAERSVNGEFFDAGGMVTYSGGCVSMNRRAMENLLGYMERWRPQPLDGLIQLNSIGRRAVAKRNVAVQIVLGDAMLWEYAAWERRNTHHRAYAPQGLAYGDYAVPDGYGYDSLFCRLENGGYRAYKAGEIEPPVEKTSVRRMTAKEWRAAFMERHKGEAFRSPGEMARMMQREREAAEEAEETGG